MSTVKNIHSVSASFFFILAFFYVFAGLAFRNDFNVNLMVFLMRLLDIPFAFIALLYGGSGLYLQINEGKEDTASAWSIVILAICLILFAGVLFLNFAFPSAL
jgi:hypothetical protein